MFLDTSGLLSLYDPQDEFHSLAVHCVNRTEPRITTNYVLVELVALTVSAEAEPKAGTSLCRRPAA